MVDVWTDTLHYSAVSANRSVQVHIGAEGTGQAALSWGRAHPSLNVVLAPLQGPVTLKALPVRPLAESSVVSAPFGFGLFCAGLIPISFFPLADLWFRCPHRSHLPPGLIVLVVFHLSESQAPVSCSGSVTHWFKLSPGGPSPVSSPQAFLTHSVFRCSALIRFGFTVVSWEKLPWNSSLRDNHWISDHLNNRSLISLKFHD